MFNHMLKTISLSSMLSKHLKFYEIEGQPLRGFAKLKKFKKSLNNLEVGGSRSHLDKKNWKIVQK